MAKGISIPIAGEAREFARAVQTGVVAPLEDADDAVKNIGRDASRLNELERNMTAAQKATSKYEGELRDAIDAQRRAARGARDVGDDAQIGFRKASQNAEEFKNEARQNFSEVTSSFDGSMQGIADLAQGTLGGLASSISGPIGLAAGLGAAALGGIFTGMADAAEKAAQESEERISTMYDNMLESGKSFITESQIQDSLGELGKDADKMKQITADAKATGIDVGTLLRANAGDAQALATVQSELNSQLDKAYGALQNSTGAYDANSQQAGALLDKLGPVAGRYSDIARDADTATGRVNAIRQAMGDTAGTADQTVTKLDAVGAAVNRIPTSRTIDVTATTSAFDAKMSALQRQYNNSEISVYVTGRTRAGERVF